MARPTIYYTPAPADFDVKRYINSAAYEKYSSVLRRDINRHQVRIDRSVFKKTASDRKLLKEMKFSNKRNGQ